MFKLTPEIAAAIIAEEDALATLRAHPIADVLASIEEPEEVTSEEDAFNALMGAMYALRPQGWV